MISVVCPFYNEEAILEKSVELMLANLIALQDEWELIIVNDGSKDGSLAIAKALEARNPRLTVAGYPVNRGRGYAIRTGIAQSRGELVITTEIDSSWGDDIVKRIVEEFRRQPDADIIIASPHLPGGGYKNVPRDRVFLSTFGNYVIRAGLTYWITMNTGMTRGYKREKFLELPLNEDEKEFHLEVVNKALAFGYRIYEISAILEWKDSKLSKSPDKKRKSSAKIAKLIRTHVLFSIGVAPFRYLFPMSAGMLVAATMLLAWSIVNLFNPNPSVYLVLAGLSLGLLGFLIFSVGVIAQQMRGLTREQWRTQSMLMSMRAAALPSTPALANPKLH